jgi:hypothetical protein
MSRRSRSSEPEAKSVQENFAVMMQTKSVESMCAQAPMDELERLSLIPPQLELPPPVMQREEEMTKQAAIKVMAENDMREASFKQKEDIMHKLRSECATAIVNAMDASVEAMYDHAKDLDTLHPLDQLKASQQVQFIIASGSDDVIHARARQHVDAARSNKVAADALLNEADQLRDTAKEQIKRDKSEMTELRVTELRNRLSELRHISIDVHRIFDNVRRSKWIARDLLKVAAYIEQDDDDAPFVARNVAKK